MLRSYSKATPCKFYKNQWPYKMGEFCSKEDTFRFNNYSRDIAAAVLTDNAEEELRIGLELCFYDSRNIIKTKDTLFVQTSQNPTTGSYYYMVYIPDNMISLSVRSAKNDSLFAQRSTWMLAQIRANRKNKKDLYFVNEKNQSCQNPARPKQ